MSIKEDAALRKEVRDLIKGQVISVGREEIQLMLVEAVAGPMALKLTPESVQTMIEKEIANLVRPALHTDNWRKDYAVVRKVISEVVMKYLQERDDLIEAKFEQVLERLLGEKLETLVSKMVEAEVSTRLRSLLKS